MRSPMVRDSTSLGPPAANGTMIVIGFDGNVCAFAGAAIKELAAIATAVQNFFMACPTRP
jgi:hypothetical protein